MNKLTRVVATGAAALAAAALVVTSGPAATGDGVTSGGRGHYADVNGLRMYYEVHGRDRGEPPLVLLHGAFSANPSSWGELIKPLARTRQVIAIEQQGHGRTADVVDRPFRLDSMARDTVGLLDRIGVEKADFYGYSLGAGVALTIGLNHPERVDRLVLQSLAIDNGGYHPGHAEAMESVTPDMLKQTEFYAEYVRLNPHPENFDLLVEKVKEFMRTAQPFPRAAIQAMRAPVLTVIGDSDIIRPEHAVELFRLAGGGVNGDITGLPKSRLAILPGTTHITSVYQVEQLVSLVPAFLDEG